MVYVCACVRACVHARVSLSNKYILKSCINIADHGVGRVSDLLMIDNIYVLSMWFMKIIYYE